MTLHFEKGHVVPMLKIDWMGGQVWKQGNQLGYCSSPGEIDGGLNWVVLVESFNLR